MNKSILVISVIILLLFGGLLSIRLWQAQSNRVIAPASESTGTSSVNVQLDEIGQINQSLETLEVGDLDKEFKQIEVELNNL